MRLAPQDSGQPVAGIRRIEVEVHHRFGVVPAVVADLHGPESAQARYSSQKSVKAIVGYVRVPMRDLVGKEVQHNSQKEGGRESGPEKQDESCVVNRQ